MVEASTKKFVVDEGGNKRQGISQEDLSQTLNDLTQWFKSNAAVYFTQNIEGKQGLNESDADSLLRQFSAQDSQALKFLLTKFDGGFHF